MRVSLYTFLGTFKKLINKFLYFKFKRNNIATSRIHTGESSSEHYTIGRALDS